MAESVKIVEGGFVVTCDPLNRVGPYALLLKDERIAELNPSPEGFKARFPSAEVVDASEKLILPGFVDPHYHGESFVLRNWTAGYPAAKWEKQALVRKAMAFIRREATKDDLILAYRSAYFAALKSGITFLSEFCFDHLDAPFLAAREALKRSDLKGFVGIHNGEQMDQARGAAFGNVRYSFVLPSEDELTIYNLQTTLRSAEETGWPIVAHVAETRRGQEAARRNFQRPTIKVLDEFGLLEKPLHLAHLSCLEEAELDVLARHRIPVIVTPASMLARQTDLPPLTAFLQRGIPLALASDWGAADPFENLRAMKTVARLAGVDEEIPPLNLIAMHTIHAARALGVHDQTGSIEPGKKADLTFVDVGDLRLQPSFHVNLPAALHTLIRQASASNVTDVMINGEFFVRRGQVMTYAEEDLKREYQEILGRIATRTGTLTEQTTPQTPIIHLTPPVPAQEGTLASEESFEEGFRIIGKTGSITEATPKVRNEEEEPKTEELPKTVRRIFGDDDY